MFEFIVGILQTVSKQYQLRSDCAEKPVFTRFFAPLRLFPLYRSRRFRCEIVEDAVNAFDLVDYAVDDPA